MLSAPKTLVGLAIFVVALCLMPVAVASGCGVCPEACGARETSASVAVVGSPASPAAEPCSAVTDARGFRDCDTSSAACAYQPVAPPPPSPLRI